MSVAFLLFAIPMMDRAARAILLPPLAKIFARPRITLCLCRRAFSKAAPVVARFRRVTIDVLESDRLIWASTGAREIYARYGFGF